MDTTSSEHAFSSILTCPLAASLTAAGLAMAEAGIHLCDLVVGVKVGLSSDNRLLVGLDRDRDNQIFIF